MRSRWVGQDFFFNVNRPQLLYQLAIILTGCFVKYSCLFSCNSQMKRLSWHWDLAMGSPWVGQAVSLMCNNPNWCTRTCINLPFLYKPGRSLRKRHSWKGIMCLDSVVRTNYSVHVKYMYSTCTSYHELTFNKLLLVIYCTVVNMIWSRTGVTCHCKC